MLRDDLLAGRRIVIAGATPLLSGFGALIERIEDPASLDDDSAAEAIGSFAARSGGLEAAVIDAASMHGEGGAEGLAVALDASWTVARAAATAVMIDGGGGTIVLIAPVAGEGDPSAAAAADGLENMARALSVEWARFDIRVVAICPRPGCAADDVAALVAWLCCANGTYASGCRIEPGG